MLSAKQIIRYEKHIELPDFGEEKQYLLSQKTIAIVGMGGLGCPTALYLASSGIGRLKIFDDDKIMMSNLQRQILFTEKDYKQTKVSVALERLNQANPNCEIIPYIEKISENNLIKLKDADLIVDATDNFKIRYLLNEFCYNENIPLVSGSVIHYVGQIMLFHSRQNDNKESGCYKCMYPVEPLPHEVPSCSDSSVFAPITGTIGTLMASESIKELLQIGASVSGNVIIYDSLSCTFSKIQLPKNKGCNVCNGIYL